VCDLENVSTTCFASFRTKIGVVCLPGVVELPRKVGAAKMYVSERRAPSLACARSKHEVGVCMGLRRCTRENRVNVGRVKKSVFGKASVKALRLFGVSAMQSINVPPHSFRRIFYVVSLTCSLRDILLGN
jgi:hypothetical protein